MSTPDEAVLVPEPKIFKVGGKEIRVAPLPVKRLLGVMKFVENNKDLVEKINGIMEVGISGFMEQEVYRRLNELIRMVVSPKEAHEFMTDEWCLDYMTNAHYRAIVMTVLQQNELYDVFLKAKAFLGGHIQEALRQSQKTLELATIGRA